MAADPSAYQRLAVHDQPANAENAPLLGGNQAGPVPPTFPQRYEAELYATFVKDGAWSTGLCDCCSAPGGSGLCCMAMWCPCLQYGALVQQLPPLSVYRNVCSSSADGVMLGGNMWGGGLAFLLLGSISGAISVGVQNAANCAVPIPPVQFLLMVELRSFLRNKYNIARGSGAAMVSDILAAMFCQPCLLCQMAREMEIRTAAERAGFHSAGFVPHAPPQQAAFYPVAGPGSYALPPAAPAYGTLVAGVPVMPPAKDN